LVGLGDTTPSEFRAFVPMNRDGDLWTANPNDEGVRLSPWHGYTKPEGLIP
jgi:hypothetical protein